VIYDNKDDLQDRYLRRKRRTALQPPRHYVPATHEFGQAIQLGLGWGMLPELQLAPVVRVVAEAQARARQDPSIATLITTALPILLSIGVLEGESSQWVEQLLPMALEHSVSTFISMGDDPWRCQRFAEEVAP
jgi:hypothetical protein